MKVVVKRSGGYAGVEEVLGDVNTERLDPTMSAQIDQHAKTSRFFELPSVVPEDAVGADMYRYEIAICEGTRSHTVVFLDDGRPEFEPLRRLIDAVTGAS